jgi:hypothetical protein
MHFKYARVIAPSLVGVMIVSMFATVASGFGGMSGSSGMGMGDSGGNNMGNNGHMWNWTEDHMWQDGMGYMHANGNGQDMQEMMEESMRYALFAELQYANGVANGTFVHFLLNETTGTVTNYSLKTQSGVVKVFDSIQVKDFNPSPPKVGGAVMLLRNESVQIIVHDNPTGMYHVVANDTPTTVSFKIADGIDVNQLSLASDHHDDDAREAVIISNNSVQGVIASDEGPLTVESGPAGTYVNVTFVEDHVMFRAKPMFAHGNMNNEQAMLQAIIQNRMACELSLMVRNGNAMYDIMEYQHQFRMRVMEAERNRVVIEVSSPNHEGKVILMNMDMQTMETKNGQMTVKLDGADVRWTANPLDVLYATGSNSSDTLYTVLNGGETSQLLIYVPSFSVHVLSVQSVIPGMEIFGIAGIAAGLAALAVVGAAAAVIFVRRK